jgi:hypothetical protein
MAWYEDRLQMKYPESSKSVAAIPDPVSKDVDDSIKIATPDLILKEADVLTVDIMTDLVFEDIGGYELATISRHDLVNGQKVIYTPIKNLTDLYLQYNPNNVLRLQSSDSFFKSLSLSIFNHLPVCGTGYTISAPLPPADDPGYIEKDLNKWIKTPNCKSVYVDPITGDLVINLINVKENEQAEVEILTAGNIFNDTIYYGSN